MTLRETRRYTVVIPHLSDSSMSAWLLARVFRAASSSFFFRKDLRAVYSTLARSGQGDSPAAGKARRSLSEKPS